MDNELLFEVEGFKVYKNSTYVVRDKEDLDAPSGFIDAGVTKLPSDGVGESFQCRYKRTSATTGIWDTGFHIYSPCYEHISSSEEKKLIVDQLMKNLVEPYRAATGDENALSHNNEEFWLKTNFQVYTGQVFNTASPKEAVELYFAVKTRNLTPKGQEGDSRFNQSAFVVVDINKDVKRKDEKSANFFKAVGIFERLLSGDKQRLFSVLSYSGMPVSQEIEDDAFRGMFDQHLRMDLRKGSSTKNIDIFIKTVEETETEEGKAKVDIYLKLKEAYQRSNKVTKNPNGVYYYEDREIGPDLKAAATNIAKTKDMESIKKDLLLLDEIENED